MAHVSTTKSIDVGSMFLMELSVHESDSNETNTTFATTIDNDLVFPANLSSTRILETATTPFTQLGCHSSKLNLGVSDYLNSSYATNENNQQKPQTSKRSIGYHRSTQHDYLGNSLDRLASAIDGSPIDDGQFRNNDDDLIANAKIGLRRGSTSQMTIVEPQPPPEITEHQLSSASSLSDESFVASSEDSLSNHTTSCGGDEEADDRGSTTTREDSGVLDIKDLDSHQLSNSYDDEHEEVICQQQPSATTNHYHNHQRLHQEKPISTTTNLIIKSANNHNQNNAFIKQQQQQQQQQQHLNRSNNNKPTNNHHHHNNNHHHHHNYRSSQRSVSASLPIEVPPRQMKKDLKKSKKNNQLGKNLDDTNLDVQTNVYNNNLANTNATAATAVIDEVIDDDFLEQEYNENHHNHYPNDEYDEEHLRAEENPMKLFESIQALARSLHEDTELFGSLPPKRMLESPIRSLAFA